jgi:hypothetical protein
MAYQAQLQRSSISLIGWEWTVILPSGNYMASYSFTKVGALWSIDCAIKEHKREIERQNNSETWEVI